MLYEPPKTKQHIIIIGASAVVLAVLTIIGIPLLFQNKMAQTPITNLSPKEKIQQEKIRKEFDELEALRKTTNAKQPTQEDIQKEFAELEKQRAEANTIPPTPEQIQAEFEKLEQMRK